MSNIDQLLENNRQWSEQIRAIDPRFFSDLADQQSPKYLWFGSSDSGVRDNTILGLAPCEIFVFRNIAN